MSQQHSTRQTAGFGRTTSGSGGPGPGSGASPGSGTTSRLHNVPPLSSDTLFVPPGSMFALGGLGILVGIGANLWQTFTSFSAFQHLFVSGPIYAGMSASGKAAALPIINIVCALVSIAFQLAILYLVFRIDRTWKDTKAHATGKGADAARHTAVELMHHVPLLLLWGGLGFIADTVGDYTFISLYSDDWFIQFMYGAALYASSTVMLVGAIEFIWAGMISYEKFKAWKSAVEAAMHRRSTP